MKKKILATLLAATMVLGLCACGNKEVAEDTTATAETTEATEEAAEEAPAADLDFSQGGNVTIWVAENVVDFTQQQWDAFIAANPDYAAYTATMTKATTEMKVRCSKGFIFFIQFIIAQNYGKDTSLTPKCQDSS